MGPQMDSTLVTSDHNTFWHEVWSDLKEVKCFYFPENWLTSSPLFSNTDY